MKDERYYVDVILPGFIEANSGIQFGVPCIVGTRIPHYVALGWVWETLDHPESEDLNREQIIAIAAFEAGIQWQRSKKRRKRMSQEVEALWKRIALEQSGIITLEDPRMVS